MPHKITRKPPRFKQDNATYFLTFCVFRRRKILHFPGIAEMLVESLKFYQARMKELIAYTIMPDHVHLMMEVGEVKDMSDFLRDYKKWGAREIRRMTHCLPPIWLRGTMDHCIRDEKDFENHMAYIFYNSWKHLRIKPKDFPHHNFLQYVEKGWFDIDFLGLDYPQDFEEGVE